MIRHFYFVLIAIFLIGISIIIILFSLGDIFKINSTNDLENNSTSPGLITLRGTIGHFISDCAPFPEPTSCVMINFYQFETVNGSKYVISNPNFTSTNLKGKQLQLTGNLSTPSTIDLGFLKGDFKVESFFFLDGNETKVLP